MSKEFPKDELVAALEQGGIYDTNEAIRESYEGRRYARPGFGIVTEDMSSILSAFAAMGFVAGENYADGAEDCLEEGMVYDLAQSMSVDRMGLGTIVYFPGWTLV